MLAKATAAAAARARRPVVVVGGGLLGAATAYHLARAGQPQPRAVEAVQPFIPAWVALLTAWYRSSVEP